MEQTTTEPFLMRCGDSTKRDLFNSLRAAGVVLAWAICFAGASQLLKRDLVPDGPMLWLVAALPTAFGVWVFAAYSRFIQEADELQRVIRLQALAMGFGGTFLAISTYAICERLGAPRADLADAITVMAVLFSLATVLSAWRYR